MTIHCYIAGAYSGPTAEHVEANVGAAMDAGDRLEDAGVGIRASIPHLSHYRDARKPRAYREWMARCFDELRRCDAVCRLPDDSPGANEEVAEMERLGRPVFQSEAAVIAWARAIEADRPELADALVRRERGDSPLAIRVRCDGCRWPGTPEQFWMNRETGRRLCYGCLLDHDREWYAAQHDRPNPMVKAEPRIAEGCTKGG